MSTLELKAHFSRVLGAAPERLHFAAHSHHPWPDVTFEAHAQAWHDAARLLDDKWGALFEGPWAEAQQHIAKELSLSSPRSIVFAPNTHELLVRLLSCLPERVKVVTTDSEFHSFERQLRRLEEEGVAEVERVPAEPFVTLPSRLSDAVQRRRPHLLFFSQVFFNSGAVVNSLPQVVAAAPAETVVVIDGYHGFMAVPTSLAAIEHRAFYLAGGYKYAMAGEGVCFLYVPVGVEWRPRNTGWFAAFGALAERSPGRVPYGPGAQAFMGATFDPSGLYRFNAVQRWRASLGLTTSATSAHVHALQARFVQGLQGDTLKAEQLLVGLQEPARGQFLTFREPNAREWTERLAARGVITDSRDDRLRFGFGVYQSEPDVDALLLRLAR